MEDYLELGDIIFDITQMDGDGFSRYLENELIKTGFDLFEEFVPYGKQFSP